jgi:NAD dependent epimerase/dehydratase family enzyme
MNILIPGGSGQVGNILERAFRANGDRVAVLSRKAPDSSFQWDGKNIGGWTKHIDWSDVVINLAGRTVNCRYTEENLKQMKDSRVTSTRVIGEAIYQSQTPPERSAG